MKPWHFAGVGLALLTFCGCHTDPAIPLLERELRLKEDEIYRLRSQIEDIQDCPVDSRARSAASKDDDGASGRNSQPGTRAPGKAPADEPASGGPPPVDWSNSSSTDVSPLKTNPDKSNPAGVPQAPKQLPGPSSPNSGKNSQLRSPSEDSGRITNNADSDGPALDGSPRPRGAARGPRGQFVSKEKIAPDVQTASDNRRVASIALDPMLTGGLNDDAGDKGLLVVIEPRDAQHRIIDAPAEVSVAVLDPAVLDREGFATRVARWDFTAREIGKMFRRTSAGPAIHIEVTWPDGPPAHSKLHVFVRYTTADGRKLEANQPIEVAPAGEKTPPMKHASGGKPDAPAASLSRRSPWSPDRQ